MKRVLIEILISSPFFYGASIFGKKLSEEEFAKHAWMRKQEHIWRYLFFMVCFVPFIIFLFMAYYGEGPQE